jgi:hypothetical protein
MSDSHSRIIAAAAKPELAPLGFQQKGRSRLWIADRGPWLNIVEFTPSRWSKSVSLMNAAHWLWIGAGFLSYNENIASNCHAEFETEDQFREAAIKIAKVAHAKALELDRKFPSFDAIAAHAVQRARSSPDRMGPSWWGYEAGVASGIVGRLGEADEFLRGVTDDRVTGRAAPFLSLIADPDAFRGKGNDLVAEDRARLKLKPLGSPAF